MRDEKEQKYDRKSELKAFDETQEGVKGLVDSGITEIPRIFIGQSDNHKTASDSQFEFPVIDLHCIYDKNPPNRKETVGRIRDASETWGFFQVINHGIPVNDLEEMLDGARRFYEQETDAKKRWYTRDMTKRTVYNCNFDLYSAPVTNWRDTFFSMMAPNPPSPEELPSPCRYHITIHFIYSEDIITNNKSSTCF